MLAAVTLAFIAAFPSADAPAGWSPQQQNGIQLFLPPQPATGSVYEAVFPTQHLDGTLAKTADAITDAAVGSAERVVDVKRSSIHVSDGAPALEIVVASLDAANQPVYRVIVVKQYGQNVAAGELRFTSVDAVKTIGSAALASLENMSAPKTGQ